MRRRMSRTMESLRRRLRLLLASTSPRPRCSISYSPKYLPSCSSGATILSMKDSSTEKSRERPAARSRGASRRRGGSLRSGIGSRCGRLSCLRLASSSLSWAGVLPECAVRRLVKLRVGTSSRGRWSCVQKGYLTNLSLLGSASSSSCSRASSCGSTMCSSVSRAQNCSKSMALRPSATRRKRAMRYSLEMAGLSRSQALAQTSSLPTVIREASSSSRSNVCLPPSSIWFLQKLRKATRALRLRMSGLRGRGMRSWWSNSLAAEAAGEAEAALCRLWMAASRCVMFTKIWSSALFSDLLEMVFVMNLASCPALSSADRSCSALLGCGCCGLALLAGRLEGGCSCGCVGSLGGFSTSYWTENISLCWMQQVRASMAISEVKGRACLAALSRMKSLMLRARLADILRCVLLSLRYLLKEKMSQMQSMSAETATAPSVGAGGPEKYSSCFSIRKSRLFSRKRLNSDRFSSSAISFIAITHTTHTPTCLPSMRYARDHSRRMVLATKQAPLSPRSISLQTMMGVIWTMCATSGWRARWPARMSLPWRAGSSELVIPPTRYSPPVHMWCTMWLAIAAPQIFNSSATAPASARPAPSFTPRSTIRSEVSSSGGGRGSSGKRWETKACMWGMAGPQKERSREMYSQPVFCCMKAKKSAVSWSMVGKSVCPPSHGSTSVCRSCLICAGYSCEFPRPVPGPMIPRMRFGSATNPFSDTKSDSGTSSSPQEAASKSLRKRKCGILRAAPSLSPSSLPHFSALAILTELSKMGPAMPSAATSGCSATPSRKASMACWKTSKLSTLRLSFLMSRTGSSLAVSTSTSYSRMFVPPTSPSSTTCNLPSLMQINNTTPAPHTAHMPIISIISLTAMPKRTRLEPEASDDGLD